VIGGELVREARKRASLTQAALAERAGTTQSAIARLESGATRPALEDVERLMRLCGYQLIVSLAPYDDSDLVQADVLRGGDAATRARQLGRTVTRLRSLREEVGRAG